MQVALTWIENKKRALSSLLFNDLLVHCFLYMLTLNHKRTTSSLAAPIFCAAKKIGN